MICGAWLDDEGHEVCQAEATVIVAPVPPNGWRQHIACNTHAELEKERMSHQGIIISAIPL